MGGEASRCESLPIDEGVVPVLSSALLARQLWLRTSMLSTIAVELDIILPISIADEQCGMSVSRETGQVVALGQAPAKREILSFFQSLIIIPSQIAPTSS